MEPEDTILRLNKFISHSGVCNRKEAVALIKKGEIKVNGNVITEPFYEVKEEDIITYKSKILKKTVKLTYLLVNKAKNSPIASSEANTKPSVEDLIKKNTDAKLTPAGHFRDDSSGLMLMTNDEELITKLSLSDNKVKAVFELETDKDLSEDDLNYFGQLVTQKTNVPRILGLDLPEVENKKKVGLEMIGGTIDDITNIFAQKGYSLTKIDCTFYGGLTKKDLKRGWSRILLEKEIIFLKHFS